MFVTPLPIMTAWISSRYAYHGAPPALNVVMLSVPVTDKTPVDVSRLHATFAPHVPEYASADAAGETMLIVRMKTSINASIRLHCFPITNTPLQIVVNPFWLFILYSTNRTVGKYFGVNRLLWGVNAFFPHPSVQSKSFIALHYHKTQKRPPSQTPHIQCLTQRA